MDDEELARWRDLRASYGKVLHPDRLAAMGPGTLGKIPARGTLVSELAALSDRLLKSPKASDESDAVMVEAIAFGLCVGIGYAEPEGIVDFLDKIGLRNR